MTAVIFKFQQPSGDPVVGAPFTVTLRKPTFDEMDENGILLPGAIEGITDAQGECTLELAPGYGTYYLSMMVPGEQETPEGCIGGLRYKFIVPESPTPVRVEDLIVTVPTWSRPWDEQALLLITEAKVASQAAAVAAEASAVRAENSAQSIEGDADRAEAARDAAEASKNAAAGSAQASANSAAASSQSADAALAAKNAAANSANAANNSAVSANGSADRASASETAANASKNAAAGSATAASGSATTATNAANSATASKDAAAGSAATASTKAGEASTSAGNALTQANRAKTEADRAVAATDGKQDKHPRLTSITVLPGTAGLYSLPALDANTNNFVAVPIATSPRDTNPARVPQVGHGGWGGGNPIPLTSTSPIISIDQQAVFVASGLTDAGLPSGTGDFFLENFTNGGGWNKQIAREVTGPRSYIRWRHGGNGNWSEWDEIFSTTAKIDASSGVKLRLRNYLGIGTPQTYCTDINATTTAQGVVLGYSYVTNATVGSKPGGYIYGVVNTTVNAGDHCQQEFVGLNAVAGVTQRAYRRSGYNGSWGAWRLVIDSDSATNNVDDGGIVSQVRSGGVVQTRFASGLQIVNGNFGQTPAIAPNAYSIINLTVPFNTGPDTSYTTVAPIASPFVTNDWYGITNAYMSTPTNLQLVVRNGASGEQAFGIRGAIIGYWK